MNDCTVTENRETFDVIVGNIFKTNDYDKFVDIQGNGQRDIYESHVKKLKKIFQEQGMLDIPIFCTTKMEVVDGNHRLKVAKELGKPITYCIIPGLTKDDCSRINSASKNWATIDYVRHFANAKNNKDYQWLEKMMTEHKGVPVQATMMVCLRNNTVCGTQTTIIKDGKFLISNAEKVRAENELNYLYRFVDLGRKLRGRQSFLYTALLYIYRNPHIDNERMYDVIMQHYNEIETQGNTRLYLKLFSDYYNKYRNREKKVWLDHMWEEETGYRY